MAEETLRKLYQAVLEGDAEAARKNVEEALRAGIAPIRVIDEGLTLAIQEVGERFARREFFLPDLMLGAKAMEAGMELAQRSIDEGSRLRDRLGTVVLGTVEGDIHEVGKNLVGLILRVNGFEVHDLGVNVPTHGFVKAARQWEPDIVGLSALLTSTMSKQKEVIEALRSAELSKQPKVVVGGAPINQQWADRIGADGYSPDAASAVVDAKRLLRMAD